jgi:RimJ/RimL family protein N-acetyltransferase
MFDPASFRMTETLSDGRKVEIRAQRPEDREGLRAAVRRKSPQSSYHRFFAVKREFSEQEAHYFLDIDFVNHVALVAEATEDGRQAIVGGCRYVLMEPGRAEVAFSVIDAYQGKGLGAALMRHIAVIAREAGVQELVAEVLSDNAPMLKVFERSGLTLTTKHEGTVVHVSMRYPSAAEPGAAGERSLTSRT